MTLDGPSVLEKVREQEEQIIAELSHIVSMSSYTYSPESVDLLQQYLAEQLRKEGCRIEFLPSENPQFARHLRAEFGSGEDQILVLAHADTVYPQKYISAEAIYQEDDRLYGPGVYDMKGGIVQLLWAVRLIKALGCQTRYRVCIIINSDSEAGGISSRRQIENEAIKSKAVFVLESARVPEGEMKSSHCGSGRYRLKVSGQSGHPSQSSPATSAIQELSFQIQRLHSLSQPEKTVVVNVGQIWGGDTVNTVSPHATALIEMRFLDPKDGAATEELILNAQPFTNCQVEINGSITRPAMLRNAYTQRLMCQVKHLAKHIGLEFGDGVPGEASDGNYAAALGVPTLDGIGPVGGGAHSEQEFIIKDSLATRTALLILILCKAKFC